MELTKNKMRVGIFYGGPSKEHEVSVISASEVYKHIDRNKYDVYQFEVSKSGQWPEGVSPENIKSKIDFALIIMHGAYGEDGTIQEIFERIDLPFSGSGSKASRLAMDKFLTQTKVQTLGVAMPRTWIIGKGEIDLNNLPDKLIIKPNDSGSTEGLQLLDKDHLLQNWKQIQQDYDGCLLQERIFGRELTVPVLGQEVLPAIEILSENEVYDYDAKYTPGKSSHLVDPELPDDIAKALRDYTLAIHNLLGCKAMSRSDYLLDGDGLYYLETNTIPGLTSTSLLPESTAHAGINFPRLIDKIIELSS
ncbi:D-alanine--D-alanine ligase [bacterium]|nr:MAG: D-alanine--D-alanine ligase [bacterium]